MESQGSIDPSHPQGSGTNEEGISGVSEVNHGSVEAELDQGEGSGVGDETNAPQTAILPVFSKILGALEAAVGPELDVWSRDLSAYSGVKDFLVASHEVFWGYYSALREAERVHYEIIREMRPCFLFIDVDIELGTHNKEVVLSDTVKAVVELLCDTFTENYSDETAVLAPEHFLCLDSSGKEKASAHLIGKPRQPNGRLAAFADVLSLGSFMNVVLSKIRESRARPLVCQKVVRDQVVTTPVIDFSIYSRNRSFRLFLSAKKKTPDRQEQRRVLRLADFDRYFAKGDDAEEDVDARTVFMESLVCRVPDDALILEDVGDIV